MAVRIYFVRIYFAIMFATCVLGQTVESPPAFEAASVKLSTGSPRNFNAGPGQIEIRNYTLHILIVMAYGVGYTAFPGPTGWTPSTWT
jgi:hypothetical protein